MGDRDGIIREFDQAEVPVREDITNRVINKLFDFSFPVHYQVGPEEHLVGYGTLYSSNRVVVERIEYSFVMIIVNSVIKTTALWLIFVFFIRRYVSIPLGRLSGEADKLNPDHSEFIF